MAYSLIKDMQGGKDKEKACRTTEGDAGCNA